MKKSREPHPFHAAISSYYRDKVARFGATARGVDWNSADSQALRFRQLLKIVDGNPDFSINDYGCGYGALIDCLVQEGARFSYFGFDLAESMIRHAMELYGHLPHCRFSTDETTLPTADYTVASGIFNVKLAFDDSAWQRYFIDTLDRFDGISRKGFAFNALTSYADAEKMRRDLYYADPCKIFHHCKTRYSRYVSLLHDYPLYEFTILVRK
jgi:hypothetical protein